jgi:5-methylcytosine-specific restriction endonuclease McrA
MGLPRYLATEFSRDWATNSIDDTLLFMFAATIENPFLAEKILTQTGFDAKIQPSIAHSLYKYRWRKMTLAKHKSHATDALDRVDADLYVGLVERSPTSTVPEYRKIKIPRYFEVSLKARNEKRLEDDRRMIRMVDEIAILRSKVYRSRTFPPALRSLIIERDGHRCMNCGKHREELVPLGLRLEVDHIVAVVDGGKTTYGNGETLCNECNIAKHHNKTYYNLMRKVRRPAEHA